MANLQSQKYRTCIDLCNECAACEICGVNCLYDENIRSLAKCVELCISCSHCCAAASVVMAGESDFSKQLCKLCAEVCHACAQECEKHEEHMEHCKQCAEICRRCEEECRKMAA